MMALGGAGLLANCTPSFDVATRRQSDPLEGGIGGTGIVGLLTDFGSLLVNGLKVDIAQSVPIETALGAATQNDLKIGQSLTVEAAATSSGFQARKVSISYPLIGTVRAPRQLNAVATINGVQVLAEPGLIGQFSRGSRVAVSGVWRNGTVVASRVDDVLNGPDVVAGTVDQRNAAVFVGDAPLVIKDRTSAGATGSYLTASGTFNNDALQVDTLTTGRFEFAFEPLKQLAVEGYLEPARSPIGQRLAGLGHSFDKSVKLAALQQTRAVYFGPYTGDFASARALALPRSQPSRRALLRGLVNGNSTTAFISTR